MQATYTQTKVGISTKVGFDLPKPELRRFDSEAALLEACQVQSDTVDLVPAAWLQDVDIDGRVNGRDCRLSHAAFSDLCHFSNVPVSFIKDVAEGNESMALDILKYRIESRFHARDRLLLIDTINNRIDGIVSKETYSPVRNHDLVSWVLSAGPGMRVSHGWMEGPNLRVVTKDVNAPTEIKVNDVVHVGVDATNSISGDGSVSLCGYNERLVCSNGMRRMEKKSMHHIRHVGDAAYHVQRAAVLTAADAAAVLPLLKRSTEVWMTPDLIGQIRSMVADPKAGGSPALDKKMVNLAQTNATNAGRQPEELTLWDMVNGITETAHDATSLKRRVEVESFAYQVLRRYTVAA